MLKHCLIKILKVHLCSTKTAAARTKPLFSNECARITWTICVMLHECTWHCPWLYFLLTQRCMIISENILISLVCQKKKKNKTKHEKNCNRNYHFIVNSVFLHHATHPAIWFRISNIIKRYTANIQRYRINLSLMITRSYKYSISRIEGPW